MGLGGSSGSTAGLTDEQIRQKVIDWRYVDDKGTPLTYDASASPLWAKHPYAEFKIMPVHMILVMDQNRLPRLLVECANSKMPIEVRKVRISSAAGTGSSSSAPSGMGAPFGGGTRGAPPPVAGMAAADAESSQDDILVEIHAVIYIFNPPDREKLGKGAAAAAAPPGSPAKAPGTPPAPATPPTGLPGRQPVGLPGKTPIGLPGKAPAGPLAPAKTPGR
jgi:hypothetical protein